jgi:DNA-binding winged helix-turn-helix (wHTH) protein
MYETNLLRHENTLMQLGGLSYDTSTQYLSSAKSSVYLRSKLNEVLIYMISNKHRPVSRDELIQNVWDGNFYTGPNAVTHCVCKLRKTLADLGEKNISIRTLPKRGYALIAD